MANLEASTVFCCTFYGTPQLKLFIAFSVMYHILVSVPMVSEVCFDPCFVPCFESYFLSQLSKAKSYFKERFEVNFFKLPSFFQIFNDDKESIEFAEKCHRK
jgi:hypothetical protein